MSDPPPRSDFVDSPSFIGLQVWLADSPWRLSGAWLLLAGFVAAAGREALHPPLLPLLLALVLVEVLWGALWVQWTRPDPWPLHRAARRPLLPYVQPGSPAARLLGWPAPGPFAAIWRSGLPMLLLALLVAAAAGRPAFWLTLAVLGAVALGVAARQAGLAWLYGWLQALVQVFLPFALGVALAGPWTALWPAAPQGLWLAALALGYLALARGLVADLAEAGGQRPYSAARLLLAAAGVIAVLAALLFSGHPVAAAFSGLMALGPLLSLARPAQAGLRSAARWAWVWVLLSSLAFGLGLG